jgi:hypothetical protein
MNTYTSARTNSIPTRTAALQPERSLQRQCACGQHTLAGGECTACCNNRLTLQRRATNQSEPTTVPPIVHEVLRSQGQPLKSATQAYMESRFDYDFSQVRVHTNAKAAASARSLNAVAYTVGPNVVFGLGQYVPGTSTGLRLLAHELAHVIQQGGSYSSSFGSLRIDPDSHQEAEAESVANSPRLIEAGSGRLALQRTPDLPPVEPNTIPTSWRATSVPLSGSQDVFVYRGFARNAAAHQAAVVREGEIGGILSRRIDAAQDAVFNQYGRDPVLSGPRAGGVVRVRIPANVWDELVRTNSISERSYPGFSGRLSSTELRVNSVEAGRLLNGLSNDLIAPDPYYDFRPGASRPPAPQEPAESQKGSGAATAEETTATGRSTRTASPGTSAEFPVDTRFRVLRTEHIPGQRVVSDVEVIFTKGLERVNQAAQAHGGEPLPSRLVLRITTDAQGALVAAESTTGEAAALAEVIARQALETTPRAAGAEAVAARTAAGARTVSPWVRGFAWAGLLLFVGVTAYQYSQATPEQRPRVLATAGGSFAGGFVSGYIACNLVLGIETFGWSLLICGFLAGIPGALAGGAAADVIYEEATIDDDEIRAWVATTDLATIGRLPVTEKVRMIFSLMQGWISDEDVATIEHILRSVTSRSEMHSIRRTIEPYLRKMTSIGQRIRVRIALARDL